MNLQHEYDIIQKEEIESDGIFYRYLLLASRDTNSLSLGIRLYSVRVGAKIGEKATFYQSGEIFANEKKAQDFFIKIVSGLATPVDLPYIIEDCFMSF